MPTHFLQNVPFVSNMKAKQGMYLGLCFGQHFIIMEKIQFHHNLHILQMLPYDICYWNQSIREEKKLFFGLLHKISSASCSMSSITSIYQTSRGKPFLVSYIMYYSSILLSINLYTRIVKFLPTLGLFLSFFFFLSQKVLLLNLHFRLFYWRWLTFFKQIFTLEFQRPFKFICSFNVICSCVFSISLEPLLHL